MCLGALGTQTGGSLARPAAYCGVASFKPSYGRLPVDGVIPLAWSLDHVGVIAGCVIDVGLLLGALCVPALASLGDPISALQKRRKTRLVREMTGRDRDPENPRSAEDREVLLNLLERSLATTFGRVRDLFDWEAGREVTSLMDRVCAFLAERGGVVEVRLPETFVDVLANHRTVMAVEAAAYHQKDYERAPQTYGPAIAGLIEEGLACPATHYARCREHQRQLTAAMKPVFNQVPVLVAPATTGPAPDAATTGDPAFNSPWSYLGLPTISLRAGQALDGMPLGIQVVGPPRGESVVYHYAALIEEVLALEPLTPPG
jgi:aspartyl-tRNA(Asn)/glutamyl-tRNA(Gln) amidotransferase subunit A